MNNAINVCKPMVLKTRIKILYCPKCKKNRRIRLNIYEWYSPDGVCHAMRKKWNHLEECKYYFSFQ